MKLVLHKNHVNKYNIYNQVCYMWETYWPDVKCNRLWDVSPCLRAGLIDVLCSWAKHFTLTNYAILYSGVEMSTTSR